MSLLRYVFLWVSFCLPLSASADGLGNKLNELFSNDPAPVSDEILDPDIAFKVDITQFNAKQLLLSWDIEPGYYLYKDKFKVTAVDPVITINNVALPTGDVEADPLFGQVEVYYGQDDAPISFSTSDAGIKTADIELAYQGCKKDSICYPPIKKTISVSLDNNLNTSVSDPNTQAAPVLVSEQDSITQKLKDKGLLINVLSFFGFGFLLAFTPCVFPMIPILSGIIVGEGKRINRGRAISLSLSYVIAMALTYAVLGILAGLFSFNLQAASQNIWVLTLFSGVFVFLALSMFGFYELQLPSSWQSKLSSGQDQKGKGTLKGAATMGVLSAVIVGPCVAPPLAGELLYISQTGDAVLGGLALFAMGLGFGVPLLVVGASSGELLPRAGAWMEIIKRIFGVIMLGVAIWFLERVLPAPASLMLWAALFITTAIFMGAMDRLESAATHWQRLWKGLGLVMMVYGVVLIVAAANGSGTVLRPFNQQFISGSAATANKQTLPFSYVSGPEELQMQLLKAKQEGKPVMLDFYADWCIACIELETYTFSDPAVHTALQNVTLLKTDVTKNNEMDKALLKQFEIFGPPAILFFNTDATEIKSHRLVGFIKAEPFVQHIEQALAL